MNEWQKLLESIRSLPKWILGTITLIITIVGFAVSFRDNPPLFVTVTIAVLLAAILILCIYVAYAKTPPLIAGGRGVYRFQPYRHLAFAGCAVTLIIVVMLLAWEPSQSAISSALVGTPTPTPDGTATPPPTGTNELVVISFYTSDTKANWINDVTPDFNAARMTISSGKVISVVVTQGDSGEQKEAILAGQIQPTVWSPGEMSWVNEANAEWQQLHNRPLVSRDCPPTAIAVIGFGMWKPMAEAMGWPDRPIGWEEIMALANDPNGWARYGHSEWGQFKFGHTHPLKSNTGRLALISVAYWALGRTDDLTPELVKSQAVISAVQDLELHTDHYGTSTRGLFERMAELGPDYLHAATTSETNLLITYQVQSDTLRYPLVFFPPKEGAFWSDNPYCVLDTDWVTDEQREAAEVYKEFLLTRDQQKIAMREHGLRPTDLTIPLDCLICLEAGTDPSDTRQTVPTLATVSGDVADAVEDVFLDAKRKAIVVVVLDTSSSMLGDKIKNATEATAIFLKKLQKDDEVYVYQFGDLPRLVSPGGRVSNVVEKLSGNVENLFATGNTTLYDAICLAVERVKQRREAYEAASEKRLAAIVVLSDGNDTASQRTESDVFNFCLPKGEAVESIPTYTIAFGEDADQDLLIRIANHSHGRFYATEDADLDDIYDRIAYEQ